MSAFLTLIITWVKHNVARTIGVAVVGLLICSAPLSFYSWSYHRGYTAGYATATKDRPTYGTVGTVLNTASDEFKFLGVRLNVWKLNLKLGI